MKKFLFILSMFFISLAASARGYRGMVELGLGVSGNRASYSNEMGTFKFNSGFLGSFTTSHGCQITPTIFIGAGVGLDFRFGDSAKTPILDSKFNQKDFSCFDINHRKLQGLAIPIFLDFRWDLDIRRRVTPFIDAKVGYRIDSYDGDWYYGKESESGIYFGDYRNESEYVEKYGFGPYETRAYYRSASSFYFKPTIGVRIKCGRNCGINMGISYDALLKGCIDGGCESVVRGPYPNYSDGGRDYFDTQYEWFDKQFNRGAWMFSLGFDF